MTRVTVKPIELLAHLLGPLCVALYLTFFPMPFAWDSLQVERYLSFGSQYGLVYPFFVNILALDETRFAPVIYAQIWLFALACFYLSICIHRLSTSLFIGIACAIILLINPFSLGAVFNISHESFFLILTLFLIGFSFSVLWRPRLRNLLGLGIMLGSCIATDPQGWIFFPFLIVIALLAHRDIHCSRSKAFIIPLLTCLLLVIGENESHDILHNGAQRLNISNHLFAQTSLMNSTQESPYAHNDPRTTVWSMIENDLEDRRREIWQAPTFSEHKSRFLDALRDIKQGFALAPLIESQEGTDKSVREIRMDIALSRIIQDPLAYGQVVFNQWRMHWHIGDFTNWLFVVPWAVTLLIMIFGLWAFVTRTLTNPNFAASFISALFIQALVLMETLTGFGSHMSVLTYSSFIALSLLMLVISFYTTFIKPIHTEL